MSRNAKKNLAVVLVLAIAAAVWAETGSDSSTTKVVDSDQKASVDANVQADESGDGNDVPAARDQGDWNRRGRRGVMRGKGAPRGEKEPSEEEKTEILNFIKTRNVEVYTKLVELKSKDEAKFNRTIGMMARMHRRYKAMSPEAQKAEDDGVKARQAIGTALKDIRDNGSNDTNLAALKTAVAAQFDADQRRHKARLARLEKEIERIRADIKAKAAQREEIVAENVERYLKNVSRFASGPDMPPPPGNDGPEMHDGPTSPDMMGPGGPPAEPQSND